MAYLEGGVPYLDIHQAYSFEQEAYLTYKIVSRFHEEKKCNLIKGAGGSRKVGNMISR